MGEGLRPGAKAFGNGDELRVPAHTTLLLGNLGVATGDVGGVLCDGFVEGIDGLARLGLDPGQAGGETRGRAS